MTPEQMEARSREYHAEGENLGQIISKMDSLLQQLQSEWEGASSESYAARYEELKPGFQKAEQLIYEIEQALVAAANTLREADQAVANAFAG
jgi:WXG100 family type VII secretion target